MAERGESVTMPDAELELLSLPRAAQLVGVCSESMRRWTRTGKVPSVTIGRRRRVPRAALARLIAGAGAVDA